MTSNETAHGTGQYTFRMRLSTKSNIYLFNLNNTIDFWLKNLKPRITPKHNFVILLLDRIYNTKKVKETMLNIKLQKYIVKPIRTTANIKLTTINSILSFEPVEQFTKLRFKTNVKRQVDYITDIASKIVKQEKNTKMLILAFDPYYKTDNIERYTYTLMFGLERYGNLLFDLFDEIVIAFTMPTPPEKELQNIKFYVLKTNIKQEVNIQNVRTFFRKLYRQYLNTNNIHNNEEYEKHLKDLEEKEQVIDNSEHEEIKETDKSETLVGKVKSVFSNIAKPKILVNKKENIIEFPVNKLNIDNIKNLNLIAVDKIAEVKGEIKIPKELLTENIYKHEYKYQPVRGSAYVKAFTNEQILKLDKKQDYEMLPVAMQKVIELKGIKVDKIEFEDKKLLNSTKDTLTRTYRFYITLPNGNKDTLVVNVPLLIEKYYFYIGGTKKILISQIINKPIEYLGNHKTRIHTLMQPMSIVYNPVRKNFIWYVVGLKMNPVLVFAVNHRLDSFAKEFGYEMHIE